MLPYLPVIKAAIVVALISTLCYLGYDKVYTNGYNEAESKYKQLIEESNLKLERSKTEIEILSTMLEISRDTEIKELQASLDTYMAAFKRGQKPVTVITPSGECKPSPEFIFTVNEIIRKANAPSPAAGTPSK